MNILRTLQNALRKCILYRIDNSSYKFFVQKLEAEPDIDLAADIYSTDFFRHNLKPLPVDTTKMKKIIVFAPHQDDEVIGCGGLLSKLHEQGTEIHLIFLTDGENSSRNMSMTRHREAKNVSLSLNATMHEIGISNVDLTVNQSHIDKIIGILETVDPYAVFATWPLDMPPIHRLCNVVIVNAMAKSGLDLAQLPIFSYQVHTALLPNIYFDYTNLFDKKQKLIGFYKSQLEALNYQHLVAGLDAWNTRFLPWSTEERYAELFSRLPAEAYIDMINRFYPKNLRQTFKGNERCIASYKKLIHM